MGPARYRGCIRDFGDAESASASDLPMPGGGRYKVLSVAATNVAVSGRSKMWYEGGATCSVRYQAAA
jgi:hypothetical protein